MSSVESPVGDGCDRIFDPASGYGLVAFYNSDAKEYEAWAEKDGIVLAGSATTPQFPDIVSAWTYAREWIRAEFFTEKS